MHTGKPITHTITQDGQSCSNCIFYWSRDDKVDERGASGQCRTYPPKTLVQNGELVTRFPLVAGANWCGEWHGKQRTMMVTKTTER